MAYHAQFHSRLLQQVNEGNARNLELQSLLARKDDELTQTNARLQNALATGTNGGRRTSVSTLQRHLTDLRAELHGAERAAAAAENNLKTITKKFAEIEADLRRQILDLQGDVRKRDELLREVAESCEPSYRQASGHGSSNRGPSSSELTVAQKELKRLRSAFASLQKQFQAEKKENAKLRNMPDSSEEKLRHIEEDQDDEETVPHVKREMQSVSSAVGPRPTSPPSLPPQALPCPDTAETNGEATCVQDQASQTAHAQDNSTSGSVSTSLPKVTDDCQPQTLEDEAPTQHQPNLDISTRESKSPSKSPASSSPRPASIRQLLERPEDEVHVEYRLSQTIPMKRKSPSQASVSSSLRSVPHRHVVGTPEHELRTQHRLGPSSPSIKRESLSKSCFSSPPKSPGRCDSVDSIDSSSSEGECEDLEEDADLANDDDFNDGEDSASPPKRPRLQNFDFTKLIDKFEFQAVTNHLSDGSIEAFHSQEDLKDECDDLWEQIQKRVDAWEEAKGEDWAYEFEKSGYKPTIKPCVTTKLTSKHGRMSWEPGCEGKYACKKCVEEGKPCFTWTGEEFWLLPLRDEDRRFPVKEGFEIRYWLNVE